MNLLMLSGDSSIARGEQGAFYHLLRRFSAYWTRIDVICPPSPGATERAIHENVYAHPSPLPKALQPVFIRRKGGQLLREHHHDLITSHDFGLFYNGIGAWWLHRRFGAPVVSEIHHIEGFPRAVTRKESFYCWLAERFYIPWAGRWVAAFRVVNQGYADLLEKTHAVAPPALLLYSMYIDFDLFQPRPNAPRDYDLIFVGRFAPNKGLFTLLDALAQVKTTHPQAQLGLLGRGSLEAEIRAMIDELGLRENVTINTEFVTPEALAEFYCSAGMLVCASTAEGGPRVAVEAMACGTPVISTPVGLMRDELGDDLDFVGDPGAVTALRFWWDATQLAQSIRLLLDDDAFRRQVGENGRLAVQHFQADQVIEAYALAYHALIAGR
jgi:glycosyltransferase involved in cell wall biosynthesis